ncbi:MAG: alpha/beta hydrolase [Sphingomonadales bacterium]|nr:alpha/beta hydrolase [Sphingomonadales bacterium]
MTSYVRPDVQGFLAFVEAQPGPKTHEVEAADARQLMAAMVQMCDLEAGELAIKRDLSFPGPAGEVPIRLYDAQNQREPGPVMVFYHGGGFVIGDLETHDGLCAETARQLDIPVVAIDYRMGPEDPFPAAPEDCEAAARWVATSPDALGLDVTGLVLAGDSAGGNLALVTALALRDEEAEVPVIALWPIYPACDMEAAGGSMDEFGAGKLLEADTMNWFMEKYAPDNKDWRASPSLRDPAGLPPTVLVTAGLDPLRDQGRAYAARMIEAGVPVVFREAKGNIHGFCNLAK